MKILQKEILLRPKQRGFHLVSSEICEQFPDIRKIKAGLAHIFIQHTSASLTVNENADPDVRSDMEKHFRIAVPDEASYYLHTSEGPDDMTSHIKATVIGSSVTLPVTDGKLNMGTWQGIYLCEHRNKAGKRRILITVIGREG